MSRRIAVLLDQSGQPARINGQVAGVPLPDARSLRREAHVSGNQIDVLHCPFCFTGTSRYITRDGIKTFAETAGTTQWVLSAERNERAAGRWVEAHIHEFGEQPIMQVTVRRNKRTKVIEATPEHRWLVKSNRRVEGKISRSTDYDVLTKDLRPGHRLSSLRMTDALDLAPDVMGIRHGVVFGDGSAQGRTASVSLWGEKDKQLLQYFDDDSSLASRMTPNGVPGVHVSRGGLKSWMKSIPSLDEAPEYLLGWLAGYFAADGNVTKQGQAQIACATLEHLEAVRDIAQRIGISTYGIVSKMRMGFGQMRPLHTVEFVGSTVPDSMFLIEDHRDRFQLRSYAYERFGWTVVSIEQTDRVEPVYCAVVPDTHSFALEDGIWVGNCGSGGIVSRSDGSIECTFCNSAFTVTVSPLYAAFPQSVGGQDYQWPGRPGDPAMMGGDPNAAGGGGGFGGGLIPGGDGGDTDGDGDPDSDGPPWADSGDSDDSSSDGDDDDSSDSKDEAEVGGKKKPPFGKKSSLRVYSTATGGRLPEREYMRHLAIQTAADPNAMAARIREERRA